jgi:hypothetical protein
MARALIRDEVMAKSPPEISNEVGIGLGEFVHESEPLSARGVTARFSRRSELFLAGIRAQTCVYTVAEQRRDFTDLPRFKLGLLDSSTRTGMRLHRACGWVKWFEVPWTGSSQS